MVLPTVVVCLNHLNNCKYKYKYKYKYNIYNYSSGLNLQPQLAIPSANINKIMNINFFPYTSWCNKKIARTTFFFSLEEAHSSERKLEPISKNTFLLLRI